MATKKTTTETITSDNSAPLSEVAVTGVTLEPGTLSMNPGNKEQLTATVEPENAADKTVDFSSGTQGVAIVSDTGEVTGVAEGEAVITVTTTDGSFTDTTTVTVASADLPIVDLSQLMADHWPSNSVLRKSTIYVDIEELTLETDQTGKLIQTPEGFVFERIDVAVINAPEIALDLLFKTDTNPLANFTVSVDSEDAIRVAVTDGVESGAFLPGTWISIVNQGDLPVGYGKLALSFIGYTIEPWR